MSCSCGSRLDSMMKFLEDMRAEMKKEIETVKTKCIRIEKEILGITAESEMNLEAIMETTTVRHLVEKTAFDVNLLTEENNKARTEVKRNQQNESASTDLQIDQDSLDAFESISKVCEKTLVQLRQKIATDTEKQNLELLKRAREAELGTKLQYSSDFEQKELSGFRKERDERPKSDDMEEKLRKENIMRESVLQKQLLLDCAAIYEVNRSSAHFCGGAASLAAQSRVPETLPTLYMAIYFGIYRTYAGIFKPGTEEFLLIADVENKLYFKDNCILNYYGDERSWNDKRKIKDGCFDFSKLIFYTDVNEPHYVEGMKGFTFRIEDFISYTFATLKWKTELQVRAKIPSCVICVPQSFNSVQKRAVSNAAQLAEFQSATLINDTNAIALTFTLEQNLRLGSIIAANTCEKFIDVAAFDVNCGIITSKGMHADHFITKQELNHGDNYLNIWKDPETKRVQNLFYFKNSDKDGSRNEHVVVVGAEGENNTVSKIYQTLQRDGVTAGPTYPLLGAAYLAAMYSSLPTNPIRDRWRGFINSDLGEQRAFTAFTNSLVLAKQRKIQNQRIIEQRRSTFYLRLQKQLHATKMNVLVKACKVRARALQQENVTRNSLDFLERIDIITDDLQDPTLTIDIIKQYDAELEALFRKFRSKS